MQSLELRLGERHRCGQVFRTRQGVGEGEAWTGHSNLLNLQARTFRRFGRRPLRCPRRNNLFPPSQNAAGEVRNIRESSLLEGQRGLLAAYASFAVDDDFAVLLVCQLRGAALNVTDRNQRRAEIRDLMLMRLADVEDEDVFLRFQLPFQLLHGDLRNVVDHRTMGCFDIAWLQPLNEPVSCRSGSSFKVITLRLASVP